jgi:hypothetical protein
MDSKDMQCEDICWTEIAQKRIQRRNFEMTQINLWLLWRQEISESVE